MKFDIPHQPTVPPMPESLYKPFQCDKYRCFTALVEEQDHNAAKEALEALQKSGFHIVNTSFESNPCKTYIVISDPHEEKKAWELADQIRDMLVEEGQYHPDKYGFHLGDMIKFTPSEVAEIIGKYWGGNE